MQEKDLFEYAVIRIVPCVEREEFFNVGVVLICQSKKYLRCQFNLNEEKLLALAPSTDVEEIKSRLHAFQQICETKKGSGPIGQLPISLKFRWLTAPRSTVIQTSLTHPGLTIDPERTLLHLLETLVK